MNNIAVYVFMSYLKKVFQICITKQVIYIYIYKEKCNEQRWAIEVV